MLDLTNSGRRARRAGDAARNREDWPDAERQYRSYLRKVPNSAAIWVQLGHAIKEQGRDEDALSAYRAATEIAPRDPDPWLHLGHVARGLGRKAEAREAFEHVYALNGDRESYDLLIKLGGSVRAAPRRPSASATFLIVDDLLKFLADHVTLSGIQRVQVGLIENLLKDERTDYEFISGLRTQSVAGCTFWTIPREIVRAIVDYAVSGVAMRRDELDRLLAEAARLSRQIEFVPGDIVFFPGAFWIVEKTGETCAAIKRAGAKIGVYVYDLIPLSHPEFCHEALVEFFARAFTEVVQFVDFFATISEYVAGVLRDFLADNGLAAIPVTALPLAHFLTISDQHQPPSEAFETMFRERVRGKPFALYVSTLEGRKNHLYVLNVWRELGRQGIEMPELVFLGRKGWRSEGLFEFLESTKNLYGKVHILHDVADGDLAYLYRSCSFSLFTSFVEGWGLPVGESLFFGRPCVASASCSIPEVGGELVDYVDPLNLRDGQAVIGRLVADDDYRAERARRITTEFRPRPWSEVADGLTRLIDRARAAPPRPSPEFRIPPGANYDFRWRSLNVNDLSNLLEFPSSIVLGDSFYAQEPFGSWMRGTSGTIALPTQCAEGEVVLVGIEIVIPQWSRTAGVSITPAYTEIAETGEDAVRLTQLGERPAVLLTRVIVGVNGFATVRLDVFDSSNEERADNRDFHIGVVSAAYIPADVSLARNVLLGTFVDARDFDEQHSDEAPAFARVWVPQSA